LELKFGIMNDTIIALTTPFGRSGIAVLRLSGMRSLEIIAKLTFDEDFKLTPRQVVLKKIYDIETKEVVDEAIITYFQSPQSFTGEDVVEISCHGSPVLIRQIIDFCLRLGARIAEAGEFSLRALYNGRMNLSQAEAIRDLIEAQTVASSRQAIRQLRGELSNTLQPLKDNLLDIIVVLESTLEFVEDDLPAFQMKNLKKKLTETANKLGEIASTFSAGRLLREGLKVTLAGRPNVGKSSLFNVLIGQERAIVTEIAGTTRDSLQETLCIKGIPVSLNDTAGLRETFDTIESIGVIRTKQKMADSDLVIVVLDGSQNLTDDDKKLLYDLQDVNYVIAINKSDIRKTEINFDELPNQKKFVKTSAKTKLGLDKLQDTIIKPFLPRDLADDGFLVSDARHFDLLNRAKSEIEMSCSFIDERKSEEIVLIGLHNAMRFLGEITGETTTEDMLTRIFSTFCIGK